MYWLTGILGILLIVAPFALGYRSDSPALWSNIILGLIVLVVSAIKGFFPDKTRWEYWVAGIMGVLAIIAPFVLSFSVVNTALWASIILGLIVAILSGYKAFTMDHRQTN
jgi:general stress protein CsbA